MMKINIKRNIENVKIKNQDYKIELQPLKI